MDRDDQQEAPFGVQSSCLEALGAKVNCPDRSSIGLSAGTIAAIGDALRMRRKCLVGVWTPYPSKHPGDADAQAR